MQPVVMLLVSGVIMFSVIGGLYLLAHYYTLGGIKSKTVGDGQHGTARFATKKEIEETYVEVAYEPEKWRKGENLPTAQGLVLGSIERAGKLYALVDTGDVHCLILQQLYREILVVADENGGKLDNRVVFYWDEVGTIPKIESAEMMFSASRSRVEQMVCKIKAKSKPNF